MRHLRELFPIINVLIETNRFDPRLLRDPDVHGKDYQKSERGQMQVREYVLQRDERTCQYQQVCKRKKSPKLETDHIVPRSSGGAYRIDNLITSCRECNQAKGNQNLGEFLTKDPARLQRIRPQVKKSMASATHINQTIPLLIQALNQTGLPVIEADAVSTAYSRKKLGIPKSQVNDALCLGKPGPLDDDDILSPDEPAKVHNLPERITIITSVGHGSRQMLNPPSKFGTPRYTKGPKGKYTGYRAYCRMPRDRQGLTTPPLIG